MMLSQTIRILALRKVAKKESLSHHPLFMLPLPAYPHSWCAVQHHGTYYGK